MDFDSYENELLEFYTAMNYTGPELEVLASNDYSGGDPNAAVWDALSATLSEGSWEWTASGQIDLASYTGTAYVAFKYTSTGAGSATWEVDNVLVTGIETFGIPESAMKLEAKIYPNPAADFFTITGKEGVYLYEILSMDGRSLMEGEVIEGERISVTVLTDGMYMVRVASKDNAKRTVRTLVVK
jgi:hypothetical protein